MEQIAPTSHLPTETSEQYAETVWTNFAKILKNSQRFAETKQTPNQEKPICRVNGGSLASSPRCLGN